MILTGGRLVREDFTVPVRPSGMDGPYQPASRWGFRAMATFADIEGVTVNTFGAPNRTGEYFDHFSPDVEGESRYEFIRRSYGTLFDEVDSTCVVPPGCVARLDAYGNIEVEIGD